LKITAKINISQLAKKARHFRHFGVVSYWRWSNGCYFKISQ
jgi:hypothetical protein